MFQKEKHRIFDDQCETVQPKHIEDRIVVQSVIAVQQRQSEHERPLEEIKEECPGTVKMPQGAFHIPPRAFLTLSEAIVMFQAGSQTTFTSHALTPSTFSQASLTHCTII